MSKVDLDSLEMVLMDQIFNGAVPLTEKMLLSLLPLFPDGIDVWCVPGNHGAISKQVLPLQTGILSSSRYWKPKLRTTRT